MRLRSPESCNRFTARRRPFPQLFPEAPDCSPVALAGSSTAHSLHPASNIARHRPSPAPSVLAPNSGWASCGSSAHTTASAHCSGRPHVRRRPQTSADRLRLQCQGPDRWRQWVEGRLPGISGSRILEISGNMPIPQPPTCHERRAAEKDVGHISGRCPPLQTLMQQSARSCHPSVNET